MARIYHLGFTGVTMEVSDAEFVALARGDIETTKRIEERIKTALAAMEREN